MKPATEILQGALTQMQRLANGLELGEHEAPEYYAAITELQEILARSSEPVAEIYRMHFGGRTGNIGTNAVRHLVDVNTLHVGTKLFAQPTTSAQPLTDREVFAKWVAATIEPANHENCYKRGFRDAEAAHGITAAAQPAAIDAALEPARKAIAKKLSGATVPRYGVDRDGVPVRVDPDGTETRGKFDDQGEFVAQPDLAAVNAEQTLWLWKNGDHFLAFEHLYPCFTPGGDPMTLGEPFGRAVFKASHNRASAHRKGQ